MAGAVVGDHRVGGVKDILGAAVVLLQLDDMRVRERVVEMQDIFHGGAAEGVDALIVVADDHDILVHGGKQLAETELRRVRILVLVHADIAEFARVAV